mgnify:CR=1 FL=1
MSVRRGDQGGGDLKVLNASRNLIKYTYDRCVDEKIFPKKTRWLLSKNIWDNAIGAHTCITKANGIRVETKTDAERRLTYEKDALGHLETMSSLIDICQCIGLVSDDRMVFWMSLISETVKPLKGWLKSDRQRYKEFTD